MVLVPRCPWNTHHRRSLAVSLLLMFGAHDLSHGFTRREGHSSVTVPAFCVWSVDVHSRLCILSFLLTCYGYISLLCLWREGPCHLYLCFLDIKLAHSCRSLTLSIEKETHTHWIQGTNKGEQKEFKPGMFLECLSYCRSMLTLLGMTHTMPWMTFPSLWLFLKPLIILR